jgi:hypothetical protein
VTPQKRVDHRGEPRHLRSLEDGGNKWPAAPRGFQQRILLPRRQIELSGKTDDLGPVLPAVSTIAVWAPRGLTAAVGP